MAITAQAGIFSFGGQSAMETFPTVWFQHRSQDIDLGVQSDDRLGPPEVGGIPTPTMPYRAGVMAAGGATIMPRLEDTFGWLFHGALGAWSSTTNKDVMGTTVTNMYNHEFVFATNQGYVPWMGFRKRVPGTASDGSDDLGEVFGDCKIISMTIAFPNDGPITTRVDVLGRSAGTMFEDPTTWSYSNTLFEDYKSVPLSCVTSGFLKIPDFSATELPITQCNFTLTNTPLDIRQEKVYGSPYLEDVTIIGRQVEADIILKWRDPQFYKKVQTGATNGTNWSAAPFVADLDVLAAAAHAIPTTNPATPWQLRARVGEMMYRIEGGIRLAGNQSVMMRVRGTGIAPASGAYTTINLGNGVNGTNYTWPT